jgi:hypothetical protein
MRAGYLYIEACRDLPEAVCLREALIAPGPAEGAGIIVFFWDLDAAMMHFHNDLRHCLIDPDRKAYRADMVRAAATLDASDLRHQRTHLAPALALDPDFDSIVGGLRHRHQRVRRIFDWVGIIGLLLLLLMSALPTL